jgi:methylenetetrahydrofolate reductase (NADPH)
MVDLTGERMPVELLARLSAAETPDARYAVGIEHATRLSRDLLDGGAPGLHLYTFNRHEAVLSVLRATGLTTTIDANKEQA